MARKVAFHFTLGATCRRAATWTTHHLRPAPHDGDTHPPPPRCPMPTNQVTFAHTRLRLTLAALSIFALHGPTPSDLTPGFPLTPSLCAKCQWHLLLLQVPP